MGAYTVTYKLPAKRVSSQTNCQQTTSYMLQICNNYLLLYIANYYATYLHIFVCIHMVTGIKEQMVCIDNYSKLTTVLRPGFDNMKHHFISKRIIGIDEQSKVTVEYLLEKIMTSLKDGHTEKFYAMLDIMKGYGNSTDEELAMAIEKNLS